MALTIQQIEVQIRVDQLIHESKYQVIYRDKLLDLQDSIYSRNKHLLENSFARFSGGVTMDMPILDFMGQQTDSILIRGRKEYTSFTIKNAILNPAFHFTDVKFPVINRRFT